MRVDIFLKYVFMYRNYTRRRFFSLLFFFSRIKGSKRDICNRDEGTRKIGQVEDFDEMAGTMRGK